MKAMRRLRRSSRRVKSPGDMALVMGMEDEKIYSIAHDNGRPMFPGGPMKGWMWKVWFGVSGYPKDYQP